MSFQLMAWAVEQKTGSPTRKAVLLALANAANHHTGECWPSVKRLCQETEFKERAVRQALQDLTEAGVISRERRRRRDGSLGTYTFVFPHVTPADDVVPAAGDAEPAAPDAGRPAAPDAAQNLEVLNQEGVEPYGSTQGVAIAVPTNVDRKPVLSSEANLAVDVLSMWNEQTGQRLGAKEWTGKIILRIREHPEIDLLGHQFIIERALRNPWWKGAPSPSVVYGNGAIFERAMMAHDSPAETALVIAQNAIDEARRTA